MNSQQGQAVVCRCPPGAGKGNAATTATTPIPATATAGRAAAPAAASTSSSAYSRAAAAPVVTTAARQIIATPDEQLTTVCLSSVSYKRDCDRFVRLRILEKKNNSVALGVDTVPVLTFPV